TATNKRSGASKTASTRRGRRSKCASIRRRKPSARGVRRRSRRGWISRRGSPSRRPTTAPPRARRASPAAPRSRLTKKRRTRPTGRPSRSSYLLHLRWADDRGPCHAQPPGVAAPTFLGGHEGLRQAHLGQRRRRQHLLSRRR